MSNTLSLGSINIFAPSGLKTLYFFAPCTSFCIAYGTSFMNKDVVERKHKAKRK
jgi:hypothetical protein